MNPRRTTLPVGLEPRTSLRNVQDGAPAETCARRVGKLWNGSAIARSSSEFDVGWDSRMASIAEYAILLKQQSHAARLSHFAHL